MPTYYLETSALFKRYRSEPGSEVVRDLLDYHVRGLPVEDTLVDEAIALMPHHPLRTADALHVATAVRVSREIGADNLHLVSGDGDIVEACRQYPLRFIDPQEPAALDYLRSLR